MTEPSDFDDDYGLEIDTEELPLKSIERDGDFLRVYADNGPTDAEIRIPLDALRAVLDGNYDAVTFPDNA